MDSHGGFRTGQGNTGFRRETMPRERVGRGRRRGRVRVVTVGVSVVSISASADVAAGRAAFKYLSDTLYISKLKLRIPAVMNTCY